MKLTTLANCARGRTRPGRSRRGWRSGPRSRRRSSAMHQGADDRVVGAAAVRRTVMPRCEWVHQSGSSSRPMPLLITVQRIHTSGTSATTKQTHDQHGRQVVADDPAADCRSVEAWSTPPVRAAPGAARRSAVAHGGARPSAGAAMTTSGRSELTDEGHDEQHQTGGDVGAGLLSGVELARRCWRSSRRTSRRRRRSTRFHGSLPLGSDRMISHRDRLAERPAEAEHRGADHAGPPVRQHRDPDHLPPGRAERERALLGGRAGSGRRPRG